MFVAGFSPLALSKNHQTLRHTKTTPSISQRPVGAVDLILAEMGLTANITGLRWSQQLQ